MAWAKVDDKLYGHPKWLATPLAARGLWVTALSWSMDHLTDGRVPRHALALFGARRRDAESLVSVGLWRQNSADEYAFVDWSDYQPDAASVKAKRAAESEGGLRGNHQRWHVNKGVRVEGCEFCEASGTRSPARSGQGESGANPPGPGPVPLSTHVSRPAPVSDANEPPPSDTELSPNSVLASHGMSADERHAFLADLKADPGVRSVGGLITGLHRTGRLAARVAEWRDLRDVEATRRDPPRDRQGQILAAEMERARAADQANVIHLQQIEGGTR